MKIPTLALITSLALSLGTHAGTGMHMACADDAKTGKKSCGYEKVIVFGGGMLFHQLLGYCDSCKEFVGITWTRERLPPSLAKEIKVKAKPQTLAKVWVAGTGKMHELHACPKCTHPFLEIKTRKELTHCPKCMKPGFEADPNKPVLAVD